MRSGRVGGHRVRDCVSMIVLGGCLFASTVTTAMPPDEASEWTFVFRDPGKEHKYLGGEGDNTRYVFLHRAVEN